MCTSLDALFLVHLRLAHLIENLINRNLNGFRFLKEEKEDLILKSQIGINLYKPLQYLQM